MSKEAIVRVKKIADQLSPWILDASDMPSKILALEVGIKFVNAVLQRYRVDEDLCEDVSYELNKHVNNVERAKIDFLYGRLRTVFVRTHRKLAELCR